MNSEALGRFVDRLRSVTGGRNASDLARETGISPRTIHNYLQGRTQDPSLSHAAAMADALGVQLEWLATGRGPMRRADPESPVPVLDETLMRQAIIDQDKEIKRMKWDPTPEERAELTMTRYRLSHRGPRT